MPADDQHEYLEAVWDKDGRELLTVARAAAALGIAPGTLWTQIRRGRVAVVYLDARTVLVSREAVDHYRTESVSRPGRRPRPPVEAIERRAAPDQAHPAQERQP